MLVVAALATALLVGTAEGALSRPPRRPLTVAATSIIWYLAALALLNFLFDGVTAGDAVLVGGIWIGMSSLLTWLLPAASRASDKDD